MATVPDIETMFALERENLYWIAFIITGDRTEAEKSIVDARGMQKTSSGVFRDWLMRWAHSVTARAAAGSIRELISQSASSYSHHCSHSDHELLSADQIVFLRHLEPQYIIADLDPLARSILVLRGIQQASFLDCSLQLNVPRRSVVGAYCHALSWLREQTNSEGGSVPANTTMSSDFCKVER